MLLPCILDTALAVVPMGGEEGESVAIESNSNGNGQQRWRMVVGEAQQQRPTFGERAMLNANSYKAIKLFFQPIVRWNPAKAVF